MSHLVRYLIILGIFLSLWLPIRYLLKSRGATEFELKRYRKIFEWALFSIFVTGIVVITAVNS